MLMRIRQDSYASSVAGRSSAWHSGRACTVARPPSRNVGICHPRTSRLVDEPPGIAQLRALYAPMTEAQLVAAGFQIEPTYTTAAMVGLPPSAGAMGYHAINGAVMGAQFSRGIMEPEHPPVVLLGPDKRVIGVEWEAANRGLPPPQIHGQTANLGPPHPGVDQPHFMLHAYFRPDGKVLFGDFDPTFAPPALPSTGAGGSQNTSLNTPALAVAALAVLYAGTVFRRAARRPERHR